MLLALLALACSSPDPEPPPPVPESTGETATVSVTGETAEPYIEPLCGGSGPAEVEVGTGGLAAFVPYAFGAQVPIDDGTAGVYGVTLDLRTTGLDTTEFVSVVLHLDSTLDQTRFLGNLALQCPNPGPGWVQMRVDFGADVQADVASGAWDGITAQLDLTLTDAGADVANLQQQLVLTGP